VSHLVAVEIGKEGGGGFIPGIGPAAALLAVAAVAAFMKGGHARRRPRGQ